MLNIHQNKILLIEDEPTLGDIIKLHLEDNNFYVKHLKDIKITDVPILNISSYTLIILDVNLPSSSGISICQKIKKLYTIPIIFISSQGKTSDRIIGLKAGADEYISKPFNLEEFLLKISIITKRHSSIQNIKNIVLNNIEINLKKYSLTNKKNKSPISISKKEFELLHYMLIHKNTFISRETIAKTIWKNHFSVKNRTIDNYILHFRKIFETNPKKPTIFISKRNIGYMLNLN